MENNLEILYKKWCKQTKRNGAILVGGSIREFFDWLQQPECVEISKLAVNTKYCLDVSKHDTGVFVVDIPEFTKKLHEQYIIIKK
jgi:hypothetical protein